MINLGILSDLLVNGLIGTISVKDGRGFIRLKESGIDAKLKQVDIFDVPEGSLLLNLDKYEQPKTLFKGKQGELKRCDYVLVTVFGNQPMLIFIEMKSTKLENSEVQKQFKGAECVIDYCNAALNHFYEQKDFMQHFKKRFVIFYRPRMAKKRTRPPIPSQKNNCPEKALKYPAPQNPTLGALVSL